MSRLSVGYDKGHVRGRVWDTVCRVWDSNNWDTEGSGIKVDGGFSFRCITWVYGLSENMHLRILAYIAEFSVLIVGRRGFQRFRLFWEVFQLPTA